MHVFPCILGREIQKIKMDMHDCVQLDACSWWDKGGGGLRVGVICGSNVRR